jgi:hypothetical protein
MDPSGKLMSHDLITPNSLYPIISTDSFYDSLINLNKFFRIAGAIVLINVVCFEFGWSPDFRNWPRQSTETTPPCWSNVPC